MLVIVSASVSDTAPLIKIVSSSPAANVPISKLPVHGVNVVPPSTENSGFIILDRILSINTTSSATSGPLLDTTIV